MAAQPVPPCPTESAVVRPARDVMSEFAPLAAAARLLRAPDAVVAPVPPYKTPIDVVAPTTPLRASSGPFNPPASVMTPAELIVVVAVPPKYEVYAEKSVEEAPPLK